MQAASAAASGRNRIAHPDAPRFLFLRKGPSTVRRQVQFGIRQGATMSMLFQRSLGFSVAAAIVTASLVAQTDSSSSPMSAPLELIHGKPFVMVMVNGKGPFRFIIDTGTGAEAFVSPELSDELKLPIFDHVSLSDASKQGGQRVPVVRIQSLQVAGVQFSGVNAVRHVLHGVEGDCQGLLGFELFRDYLLTIDYPNRRLSLASGNLKPDGEQTVLPFKMPDRIPIIELQIGPVQIDAQIDSGGTGLSLPEGIAGHLKFENNPEFFGIGESLSTRFELRSAKLASDVHLGRYTFTRPFVEINTAFPLANFGSSAMQDFTFTFDQKESLVRFESSKQTLFLGSTPTPIRMERAPTYREPELSLIPVG